MAHFAKLDENNQVVKRIFLDNRDILTPGGFESETVGLAVIRERYGPGRWLQYSCKTSCGVHREGRTPIRANAPCIGAYYNQEHDIFHPAKPEGCDSWTLDPTKGTWVPPHPTPAGDSDNPTRYFETEYLWDEAAYQADNTAGWVLITP